MPVKVLALTRMNIDADIALDKYLSVVGPLMESAGANIICRYVLTDSVAGADDIQFVTVIEYPDEASVRSVFDSPEYKSLDEVKKAAFAKYQVSIIAAQ